MTTVTAEAPEKFVMVDGVRVLNEKWREWRDVQFRRSCGEQQKQANEDAANQRKLNSGVLPSSKAHFAAHAVKQESLVRQQQREVIITWQPASNENTALGFCNSAAEIKGKLGQQLSASAAATMEIYNDPAIRKELGLGGPSSASADGASSSSSSDLLTGSLAGLNKIFQQFDVPAGLANRLLSVADTELIEFIIDDSASMAKDSNVRNRVTGKNLTRWQEVKSRLQQMLQLLAYVPGLPPIDIVFLNSSRSFTLKRVLGESPNMFLRAALGRLDDIFGVIVAPFGNSPIRQAIWASFQRHKGHSVARYLFCDGEDDDKDAGARGITQMLIRRKNPQTSPFTFISCSNEDCAWMKECEEAAPYVAELDDFEDEQREVLRSQGIAFPYSMGVHLISQLCAAMSPDDLDALDESAPLTRETLNNLLGHTLSDNEYAYYFREFLRAQRSGDVRTALDRFRRQFALNSWPLYEKDFATVRGPARMLPVVQQFREAVKQLKAQE